MNRELTCSFLSENGIAYKQNENMARYTTFKIGGNADFLVEVNNETELIKVYEFCRKNDTPLTVLGKGSNVLVSDDGIDGIVMLLSGFDSITVNGDSIVCGAGAPLTALCNCAAANSLSGLEFAFGIPGTVGGAVIMNAGAYDGEIKDVISSVRYLDTDGQIKTVTKDQMALGYRTSIFKTDGGIILSAEFTLKKGNDTDIKAKMADFMSRRKSKQPLEYPSAGSTFKRPEGYFAGALIQENDLKGFSVGGAKVSEKHAGFVINYNNATSQDVKKLMEEIQKRVYENNNVKLEPEVIFVGRE